MDIIINDIMKSNTYLPDANYHDDLDRAMLEFVKSNLIVMTVFNFLIIPKILTVQRWGKITDYMTCCI